MSRQYEPCIQKKVKDDAVSYTLYWSPIIKVDKLVIMTKVPAMPGIFELYYLDEHKKLSCFYISRVWYGGLLGMIREATDPLIVLDRERQKVLEEKSCFFRYTIVNSFSDMRDLMNLLACTRGKREDAPPDSGRYADLFLKEETIQREF